MTLSRVMKKIVKGKLWTFRGGIHPDEHKRESSETPIVEAALPPLLVLPLKQHVGSSAEVIVKAGDRVLTGQPLTRPESRMQVPIHAPTSGTITCIDMHTVAHPSGLSEPCIHIKPDGLDEWRERFPLPDYQNSTPLDLVRRIHESGIVGLGGAGFPTDVKLATGREKVEILIVNGAECEPYISCDDRLMREEAARIAEGIEVVRHILKPKMVLVAIEDNKPEAIAAMRSVVDGEQVQVRVIPTKYPSGAARQLIEILTGQQVPSGKRSLTLGIVVMNVATVFSVRQAIIEDEPLIRRVVTLTGQCFGKPGNAWVRIGTSVRWLLGQFKLLPEPRQRIIMGGPMMGFTLPHADVPVIKVTNCLMAPSEKELPPADDEMNCIRCGKCASVCPVRLQPQQLYWYCRAGVHDKVREHCIDDCIECGACAWVCSSRIPLTQYFREEKAELNRLDSETTLAERARTRYAAKKLRLETERTGREARHQQAGQLQREQMTAQAGGEDPIAAAILRVKAKQEAQTSAAPVSPEAMQQAREARKQQALIRQQLRSCEQNNGAPPIGVAIRTEAQQDQQEAVSSAVAAAIARAKAKKLALASGETSPTAPETAGQATADIQTQSNEDAKKAAVAAAIARAKAKKPALVTSETSPIAPETAGQATADIQTQSNDDAKKAAVAAAIARAKAKKAAQLTKAPASDEQVDDQTPKE